MDALTHHAYQYCKQLAYSHYENFPVASILLPKKIRQPITAIYAFARSADDIADEGKIDASVRLERLSQFEENLIDLEKGRTPSDPIFIALQHTLQTHSLPFSLFFDLLKAFKQDVIKKEYGTFQEVLDYCQHSANPIGRLLLHLTNHATEKNLVYSDALCTALQLINFMQDIHSDIKERDRCYFPKQEMQTLNIETHHLLDNTHPNVSLLLNKQLERIQNIFDQGRPLYQELRGLFAFEILLIIQGGQKILNKLFKRHSTAIRPILNQWDWIQIFSKSCLQFL